MSKVKDYYIELEERASRIEAMEIIGQAIEDMAKEFEKEEVAE